MRMQILMILVDLINLHLLQRKLGEHIFCTLNTKHKYGDFPIVSVQTFVSNEFKESCKSELKGFEFELVWKSDEKNDEQK